MSESTFSHIPAKDKVLLVYSGGLDTSVCIPLMRQEYGYKHVVTVTVDAPPCAPTEALAGLME